MVSKSSIKSDFWLNVSLSVAMGLLSLNFKTVMTKTQSIATDAMNSVKRKEISSAAWNSPANASFMLISTFSSSTLLTVSLGKTRESCHFRSFPNMKALKR